MHILHVYKDYYPVLGGIENYIRLVAEAHVQRGHTVTVLVTNSAIRSSTATMSGVHVTKAGRLATIASTPLSLSLFSALRHLQPDVTHLHAPYPLGEVAQWLLGSKRPYVFTYHADATRPIQRVIMRLYGPLFQHILREACAVMATSPAYARSSPYLRAVPADRLKIVPLGIDPTRFSPAPSATPRPFTVLFAGLLRHYKGVDDLLRALPQLPHAHLKVVGTGPMLAEWSALAQVLGLADRVAFLGRVPDEDLPGVYRNADVFVLPALNRAEAFGTVLLEAMASSLPCVTTEIGSGNSFAVQHEVTGLVVPPRAPDALAAALQQLLAAPEQRAAMGAAGRARVLAEFSLTAMIERVERVYEEVIAAHPTAKAAA
jgi:glycosyltransferase involved in cell wall biosynthesis